MNGRYETVIARASDGKSLHPSQEALEGVKAKSIHPSSSGRSSRSMVH